VVCSQASHARAHDVIRRVRLGYTSGPGGRQRAEQHFFGAGEMDGRRAKRRCLRCDARVMLAAVRALAQAFTCAGSRAMWPHPCPVGEVSLAPAGAGGSFFQKASLATPLCSGIIRRMTVVIPRMIVAEVRHDQAVTPTCLYPD